MKVVVMVDKSAGNDSVRSMWTETFIFDESTSLKNVFKELGYRENLMYGDNVKENIRLQVARGI